MKKFKKIIPALCMLLVSAVLLGTSTFAWFSINNQVTAGGMNVSATSNTQFLVISSSNTLGTDTNLATVTKTSGGVDGNKVYPCAQATEANKPATGLAVGDWYTAQSKDFDDAADLTGGTNENAVNVKKIETSDLTNYHLTYTFYVGLASGSSAVTSDLQFVGACDGFEKGITAFISIDGTSKTMSSTTAVTFENVALSTTATTVTVVLYINGNNSNVKSSSALDGIAGTLGLTITATDIAVSA